MNCALSGSGLTKVFGIGRQKTVAVDHVDFNFYEGEISRSWVNRQRKDHFGENALGLISTTEGEIYFQGRNVISVLKRRNRNIGRTFRQSFRSVLFIQHIQQDRCRAFRLYSHARGGKLPHVKKVELMAEACSFVNLKVRGMTNKYPFELSGGQMQRLMIARIFLLKRRSCWLMNQPR